MRKLKFALAGALVTMLWLGIPCASVRAQETAGPGMVLQEFMSRVLERHPALDKAQAELDAIKAQAHGMSRPLYNPEIEFGYENGLDETKEVGISQTLDLSGKRGARSRAGANQVRVAETQLEIIRKSLIADILAALSDYHMGKTALGIAEDRIKLNQDFLALAERRSQAGDLPKSELLTARLALAEARADASNVRLSYLSSKERLMARIGNNTSHALPLLSGTLPQNIADVDVETLPELQLAAAQTDVARARIRIAKRNRIPDPTLGFSVGNQSAASSFGDRETATLFGVRLAIPLPVMNNYRADVDAAGADWIALQRSYDELRLRLDARLRTSRERYQAASNAWREWINQGAVSLEEQRELLQRLWQTGEINAIDYIIQLNQTFATENAGATLKGQLWITWFEWLEASGAITEWVENIQ